MIWIAALGNPGSEYERTRHNVGWMVADQLVERLSLSFELKPKFQAAIARSTTCGLIKPQTFMNRSGEAVRSVLQFYDADVLADPSRIYVIHDDLDMRLGTWKLELAHGPKVHNGLLSLYQHLGTEQFWHVRVGIDSRIPGEPRIPGKDYVLQPFAKTELVELEPVISAIVEALEKTVTPESSRA